MSQLPIPTKDELKYIGTLVLFVALVLLCAALSTLFDVGWIPGG